jgi:predicted  nucleic acid-binding Zn-ribbon protein
MHIESKNIKRTCTSCGKIYDDEQTIINGFPCYKFAICCECRKALVAKIDGAQNPSNR